MKQKKLIALILSLVTLFSVTSASAMTTSEFEKGMKKGKEYFEKNMYYEACDEFQWFCDYNWWQMNDGQRKYALDYLDGTKAKFAEYVYMYIYSDGIKTINVHQSKIAEYAQYGWSLERPTTKYEPTYAGLENMAVKYWKDWLYWPNLARIHQMRIGSTWDDWDKGILNCDVYIDATVYTDRAYYARYMYIVTLSFNKYTGEYTLIEVDERR